MSHLHLDADPKPKPGTAADPKKNRLCNTHVYSTVYCTYNFTHCIIRQNTYCILLINCQEIQDMNNWYIVIHALLYKIWHLAYQP